MKKRVLKSLIAAFMCMVVIVATSVSTFAAPYQAKRAIHKIIYIFCIHICMRLSFWNYFLTKVTILPCRCNICIYILVCLITITCIIYLTINYDYIKDKMDTMLDDFMDKVTEGIVGEDKEEG